MEPDLVEIPPPPPTASGSRTRKSRKAITSEVIDVDQYDFRNFDKKNKGKAIQEDNEVIELDVEVLMTNSKPWGTSSSTRRSLRNQETKPNGNYSSTNIQSWDFFSGSVLLNKNQMRASASSSRVKEDDFVTLEADNVKRSKEKYLREFKRFDTVDDFPDHHYASQGQASKQHTKNWSKKIQTDWKILENDLPETIFVRACESRMDLLRAIIIGAEGTPYHDGLFFFDIQFPDSYPSTPPKVHYHSGGLRINPNLYNCGKVCLSLLGTWSGNKREKWIPTESTMLQLLVSIQALILNQDPYFNEPGYEHSRGSQAGQTHSKSYSENVFVLSLNTMVYSMRRPPKHFEEFVRCHFYLRAKDIVKACNAYKEGAPVGSMVKGGVQDLEESSETGSVKFKTNVGKFMKTVVGEFVKLGVKDLEDKPVQSNNANTGSSTITVREAEHPSEVNQPDQF